MRLASAILCTLLLASCERPPTGFVDSPSGPGPQRGAAQVPTLADAGQTPPDAETVGQPDAGATTDTAGPSMPDVGSSPDTGPAPIVDALPIVDLTPAIEVEPPKPVAPACRAPSNGQIDEWLAGPGNCSYGVADLPAYVAAIDSQLYANGAMCGSCLEVSSARGTVTAVVVDQYPVPPSPVGNKISLSRAALDKVAPPGTSIATMKWRWVPCPVTTPIAAALKNGSHQYYWAVMLKDAVNRVVKVESLTGTDKTWRLAKIENDGFFLGDVTITGLPAQLRLTDTEGAVVTTGVLTWPTSPVTKAISLGVQFAPACAP